MAPIAKSNLIQCAESTKSKFRWPLNAMELKGWMGQGHGTNWEYRQKKTNSNMIVAFLFSRMIKNLFRQKGHNTYDKIFETMTQESITKAIRKNVLFSSMVNGPMPGSSAN